MTTKKKKEKIACARCVTQTNHTLLLSYTTSWSDDENDVQGGTTHDFMRCDGCESGTYRKKSWFSEESGTSVLIYPPRDKKRVRREPKSFDAMTSNSPLRSIYHQTIVAFNQDCFTLAGAGVRLILEGVCNEKKITEGPLFNTQGAPVVNRIGAAVRVNNLEGKINGLAEKNFVSISQANDLHQIRFLGNDAAHELDMPTPRTINLAIDIVEHILEQVYVQPKKAKSLAARKRPEKPEMNA